MDYSKLSDFEINKLVGDVVFKGLWSCRPGTSGNKSDSWYYGNADASLNPLSPLPDYCNNPADAWPIITSRMIAIVPSNLKDGRWAAHINEWDFAESHENPLRAAMIAFLKMQESANVQDNPAGYLLR